MVICLEVLEHVENPKEFISNISSLLSVGGVFITSTLNRNIKSKVFAIWLAENLLSFVPRGTHDWSRFIIPSEMRRYGYENGLEMNDLTGMVFDFRSRNWKLSKTDFDVNYFATFKKLC